MKIVSAEIVDRKGAAQVVATLEDGAIVPLFEFFTDELAFTADEFVGLSVVEAYKLHAARDVAYLRS